MSRLFPRHKARPDQAGFFRRGLALAELMLDRGNKVIICGRRRARLQEAKKRRPGLNIRVCDISLPRSRRALTAWLTSEFKDLNILVNNAGIQRPDEDIMLSQAVGAGIIDALKGDKYEVALGAAAYLRAKREGLFAAINQ